MAEKTTAWMIVRGDGKPEVFDYRLPVYWFKHLAVREMKKKCRDDPSRVVKVQIIQAQ